jgi:hypothetical protein
VISQIEGTEPRGDMPRVEPTLIVRASTAPPALPQD